MRELTIFLVLPFAFIAVTVAIAVAESLAKLCAFMEKRKAARRART